MPSRDYILDDDLEITIFKRRNSRNLRLSISPTNQVRVSIPYWAPYSTGLKFARSRSTWIRSQQKAPSLLTQGQAIGKAHHLEFVAKAGLDKVSGRTQDTTIKISYPDKLSPRHAIVQAEAEKACIRALRVQAEQLLPQRLDSLAKNHGFDYKKVKVKHLKSRWGSCDQDKNIVLNLFLMQLPWNLIDYVLMHELTHTKVLKHGPIFWRTLETNLPGHHDLRKAMRAYRPTLLSGQTI